MLSALIFGLLVAAVHGGLEERIKRKAREKLEHEMTALVTEASTFEPIPADRPDDQPDYYLCKDANDNIVVYAIIAEGSGFADKIQLLVAFDAKLEKLRGIAILKTNETPGFGDKIKGPRFKDQFADSPIDQKLIVVKSADPSLKDQQIVAITGATVSSEAVTKIVNEAIVRIKNLK